MDSISSGYMTCELKVDTQTSGWHKSLTKVLTNIDEVSYSIDAQQGIAHISGKIEAGMLLKLLAKVEKHAELCWVDSGNQDEIKNPNETYQMPLNGYGHDHHGHYNDYQGHNYPYTQHGYYVNGPQQRLCYPPYSQQPELYPASAPFYEPPPMYFPQPPAPLEDFNVGDPQWCSIM